ncbi:MAG: hypothetical protein ACR2N6_08850 [Miltoncostaeaceae bacterium]
MKPTVRADAAEVASRPAREDPPLTRPHHADETNDAPSRLSRELGVLDATVVGLGAMIGAGIFVAIGAAADVAGAARTISLGIAAVVAFANAASTAQLAAVHPARRR